MSNTVLFMCADLNKVFRVLNHLVSRRVGTPCTSLSPVEVAADSKAFLLQPQFTTEYLPCG
ncbi:hypothetical protein BCON_0176g00020 [Botryotinia convoluta]|uniref:Uncharacterized protein n=1 Tax=Botryotinia convoluta TaxID=54673 RepID=A0A4Z1HW64_9HELO|nr:hypothetical protein BCON_0176g00020 [Botryotinia convoluta]